LPEITLRAAVEDDLPIVHKIETSVYNTPWTLNFFRIIYYMNQDLFLVATHDDTIIGYTVGEIETMGKKSDQKKAGHILNIAVKPEYQGKGVGTILLDKIERLFTEHRVNAVYLEVRESNLNAQRVYKNRGYRYVRTAENYYGDEDGFIMSKSLYN
jgi:[ribosomal protein S18]-alanine N-acetyltransferase